MTAINEKLASKYINVPGINRDGTQATTEQDTGPDILKSNKVSPGITTIDRYSDPMCSTNEYIYCVDGQIECQDIFGGVMNNLQSLPPYISGSTLNSCSSYINQVNLSDYTTQIGTNPGLGIYFDLSNCTDPNVGQWRVGGTVEDGNITQGSYTCYASQTDAENAMNAFIDSSLNLNTTYNAKDDVYVLSSYLNTQNVDGLQQALAVLDSNKQTYKSINGQKYYYGNIYAITGDTYTVSINGGNIVNVLNVPKTALLKNSLYNKSTNDYYSDLKTGSYPRPVCKSGRFTGCMSSPPFIIKNGIYVSSSDPTLSLYTDGSDPNQARNIQAQNDLISYTPFSQPPVNPSGIIDKASTSLLEYNYFASQPETPFIKCIADYGSNIGDPLCCNQDGQLKDTKYICPQEVPTCKGYSATDNAYGYCN